MAVDFMQVQSRVADELYCPGQRSMFEAYSCDLSQAGPVVFPFWFQTPIPKPDCVIWGTFSMNRDTAVYLAKEQIWKLGLGAFGTQVQSLVPTNMITGDWDCNTARMALFAYQQMIRTGAGADATYMPLDGTLFAYLLTGNDRIQTAGQNLAKTDPNFARLAMGNPPGPIIIPLPVTAYGAKFVGVQPSASCSVQSPASLPEDLSAQGQAAAYSPVSWTEHEPKSSWLLPGLVLLGAGMSAAAIMMTSKNEPRPKGRATYADRHVSRGDQE